MLRNLLTVVLLLFFAAAVSAQQSNSSPGPPQTEDQSVQSPEGVVRELYSAVCVTPGGKLPNWEKVRGLFYKDAAIFVRTSRSETATFSVQGFIDDFVAFNERARVQERGYTEKVVRLKPLVFQNIAHVLVLYEASITNSPRPPQKGVDSFQLIKKDGRWWILSVANDVPDEGAALPKELQD